MEEKKHGVLDVCDVERDESINTLRIGPSSGFDAAEFRETLRRRSKLALVERAQLESKLRELSSFQISVRDISHRLTDAIEQEAIAYALSDFAQKIGDLKKRIAVLHIGDIAA